MEVLYNVRPPSDVSWLTKAPVTIVVISTINHSDIGVINQLRYLGGLTLYHMFGHILLGYSLKNRPYIW